MIIEGSLIIFQKNKWQQSISPRFSINLYLYLATFHFIQSFERNKDSFLVLYCLYSISAYIKM